ncbi:MAG TPA: hypothetical protein VN726_02510 [Hanamia sp.]|nr:hypothetical protein [Hanamia sp.]
MTPRAFDPATLYTGCEEAYFRGNNGSKLYAFRNRKWADKGYLKTAY